MEVFPLTSVGVESGGLRITVSLVIFFQKFGGNFSSFINEYIGKVSPHGQSQLLFCGSLCWEKAWKNL